VVELSKLTLGVCPCRARPFFAGLILLAILLPATAYSQGGQGQTGVPPLGTVGGGPEQLNLADLSIHLYVPAFARTGRGIPLQFGFPFDGIGFTKVLISPGVCCQWSPVFGGPFGPIGGVVYTTTAKTCTDTTTNQTFSYTQYDFTSYQDPDGTTHSFGRG
jgi:hypothetical protein